MTTLVGKKAPHFEADALVNGQFEENFSLEKYVGEKYVVFYFYPLDFAFVCPTEIIAFQRRLAEFEALSTAVVGCSVDSKHTHWAWLNTPQKDGGIEGGTISAGGRCEQNNSHELRRAGRPLRL